MPHIKFIRLVESTTMRLEGSIKEKVTVSRKDVEKKHIY